MVKVFISQPMNGKSEEEIQRTREKAIASIRKDLKDFGEEAEVLESYFEDYNPDAGCVPLKYLAKSIELLADADWACFADDWEHARGCRIEHACALSYGIPIVYA